MEIKYEPFRHVWHIEKNGIICYVPEWAVEYIKGMESENAKLRELVRHLYVCNQRLWIDNGVCVCALCPYLEYDCEFEQRMRELGIEVQS